LHHDYVDGEINNSLWDRGQQAGEGIGGGCRPLWETEEGRGEEARLHRNRSDVTNLRRGLCRGGASVSLGSVFASVVANYWNQ